MLLSTVHLASHLILAATSSTSKTKSSSSSGTLLLLIVLLGAGGYFIMRPRRKRLQAQQQAQKEIAVGDEVITTSGIYGRVVEISTDRATLEIAAGTRIEIARQAIARTIPPSPSGDGFGGTSGGGWAAPTPDDPPGTTGKPGPDDPPGGFS